MKKIVTLFMTMTLMLLTGCGTTIYRDSSSTSGSETPCVNIESSAWWGDYTGKYVISATGYGTICSGLGYSDKSSAVANPLEIRSAGYEIVVTLVDGESPATVVTMVAGDTKLISCESDSVFTGYLYVIVV